MKCFRKDNKKTSQFFKAGAQLKAVSDENRLKIICILKDKEECVCNMAEYLKLPQNLVSHHLKVLKEHNIVSAKKKGLMVFYSLNKKELDNIIQFFSSITNDEKSKH